MDFSSDASQSEQMTEYLKSLEKRISRIERRLNLDVYIEDQDFKLPPLIPHKSKSDTDALELQIGQYWFAKVGIVVLAVAIILLLTFPFKDLHYAVPSAAGFLMVGVLFALSRMWKNSLEFISRYIFGAALLLLYFNTLRLHFFGTQPVIENTVVETIVLLTVNAVFLYAAFKKVSPYLNSIGVALLSVTALVNGSVYIVLTMMTLTAVYIVYLKIEHEWGGFYVWGIAVVYLTHLLWSLNNPVAGNRIELVASPGISVYFLLLYLVIFAAGNYFRHRDLPEGGKIIISSIINCAIGYGLFTIITLARFSESLVLSHFTASVIFLSISLLYWYRERSKYSTFFYAILGYSALSVAIIAQFPMPDFFVWLSWQSLVVVSTAVMFRSKIIIVANFIIYALVFFAYLAAAGTIGFISLSFGVVALLSARILNWQKDKLQLKTDVMRICYLSSAFFIFPYGLYHTVPQTYISISWIAVSLFYYGMSRLLDNNKYRWMAILTLLLTVGYVAVIGITQLEAEYRIITFSALGLVLIAVSIAYTKYKINRDSVRGGGKNIETAENH